MTPLFDLQNLSASGCSGPILKGLTLSIQPREIFAVIGPAGSGKTTLLRILNRMIDLERRAVSITGGARFEGTDLLGRGLDLPTLRRQVGMVFAIPLPLPLSIRENLTLGMRLAGVLSGDWAEKIEASLRAAALWNEVKDRLDSPAMTLSGGQQQRLCLARALALEPKALLLDEPCSGLDPVSTAKIEEALQALKERIAVGLVTHNVKQAPGVWDRPAFLCLGDLVECKPTAKMFTAPEDPRTADYLSGRFG